MLKIKDLNFSRGKNNILKEIELNIEKKEFIGIIGENGCVKSTLLKNVYRIHKPEKNCVCLNEKEINEYSVKDLAKNLAVLSQNQKVSFDFTVKEIVEMGLYAKSSSLSKKEIRERIDNSLEEVGMFGFKDKSFLVLSGGGMQRVLIARAIAQETDIYHFNLGFIQASTSQTSNEMVDWAFGGYPTLSEDNGQDVSQYQAMKKVIKDLRNNGGDIIISVGGLSGTALWEATNDVDKLTNTYRDIVNGFGLTRIDLDIEGPAQNYQKNVLNAKAIKQVQDETNVEVVLTLAVLPTGLTYEGLNVLTAYLEAGVDIKIVNLMTMCY